MCRWIWRLLSENDLKGTEAWESDGKKWVGRGKFTFVRAFSAGAWVTKRWVICLGWEAETVS